MLPRAGRAPGRMAPLSEDVPAMPDSQEILDRLMGLHPKTIDLSLGRMERLLARLGHPERDLPPVVHVGGTNGKGSVVSMLTAMLQAGGYRTHAYISPHLVHFNERIVLDGKAIEDAALAAILEECEAANDGAPITFFEITTAAAFLAYSRAPADALVLEVGLGGRLDATNVITPVLSAITPVSLDHQQFLGDTIAEIAGEKAGVLKAGVPAVVGTQSDAALQPIVTRAAELDTPLRRAGIEWRVSPRDGGMHFADACGGLDLPAPALVGRHQVDNAGIAVAGARVLGDSVFPALTDEAIARGLEAAVWPGRLQQLSWPGLPAGWELWLDGGHNPAAGQALAVQAAAWEDRPLHLVVGMLNSKDPEGFLAPLARCATSVNALDIPGEAASLSAADIIAALAAAGLEGRAAPDLDTAFSRIAAPGSKPGRILVCGSLYLVGKVLGRAASENASSSAGERLSA